MKESNQLNVVGMCAVCFAFVFDGQSEAVGLAHPVTAGKRRLVVVEAADLTARRGRFPAFWRLVPRSRTRIRSVDD